MTVFNLQAKKEIIPAFKIRFKVEDRKSVV